MEFIIVTGVTGVRVLNLLDTNFLSIIWSCAQGRSSHFGNRYRKYLFDKIRTSRALKVISSFVKPGEKNIPAITMLWQLLQCNCYKNDCTDRKFCFGTVCNSVW